MYPQIQYLQMMAQRFAGTPVGQWFANQASKAIEKASLFENNIPRLSMLGPNKNLIPPRPGIGDKLPMAPFSRGAAGIAGAGSVIAGGGRFEGVRDRLMASPEAAPALPPSFWEELNARGAGAPTTMPSAPNSYIPTPAPAADRVMDSTIFGEDVGPRPAPMRAMDSTLSGYDAPAPVRRAVQVARSVMPQEAPTPPRRPVEAAPAPVSAGPSSRDLWEIYNQTESPADFARADAAMRAGRAEGGGIPEGMSGMRGLPMPDFGASPDIAASPDLGASPAPKPTSGAGGSSAAINKALEIIHHLVIRGR